MPEKTNETWHCPICSLRTFPYGKPCPDFKAGFCENEGQAHATGVIYLKNREAKKESRSIGISEIMNGSDD